MATRVLSPARQAWKRGFIPWMKHAWDNEPVLVASCLLGGVPTVLFLLCPPSYKQTSVEMNKLMPKKYPIPIRYVEGKTGPPTSI